MAGHGYEGGGDFLDVGFDVSGGGGSGAVGVAGVGAGDAVGEVAFDPGEGCVAEPVGRDALGRDPGEVVAEACPDVVVAAGGDGAAVAVAEQLVGGEDSTAGGGVIDQAGGEGWGDGLPAHGVAFLVETHEAEVWVEVLESEGEGAAAAAGGLGVQPQEEGVEDDVIAAGPRGGVDLVEFPSGERAAGVRQPAGFRDTVSGTVLLVNEAVGDRAVVDSAGRGDDVFAGVATVSTGASGPGGRGGGVFHGFDVAGQELVEVAVAPGGGHPGPVGAVRAVRAGAGGGDDGGQILIQCGDREARFVVLEVGEGDAEFGQCMAGCGESFEVRGHGTSCGRACMVRLGSVRACSAWIRSV